ncbi:MAG: prepilin-type N-terminal cleavage/methylation domain-containing protein [Opitutaceae bacterium]
MSTIRDRAKSGFTLVELMVGMTLALIVMAAVISCFVFLSRNLARLQIQQKFESQGRRALLIFSQDVRMATAISTPTTESVSLSVVTPTGTTNVVYNYDFTSGTLTRTPGFSGVGTSPAMLINLTSFSFTYYDVFGHPYPLLTNYLIGIKQVSMSFNARSSATWNLTQPPFNYQVNSARVILRNKPLLP